MADAADIQPWVDNPERLIDLCRQVVQRLWVSVDAATDPEKKQEWREVQQIIASLERIGIPPPPELVAKRDQLLAALTPPEAVQQALRFLMDAFADLQRELEIKLNPTQPVRTRQPTGSRSRSRSPRTHMEIFKRQIILALQKLGGRAEAAAVVEEVGKQLQGQLTPGDLEWSEARNMYAWQHKTHWARWNLRREGVLRQQSPRGIWELSDEYLN